MPRRRFIVDVTSQHTPVSETSMREVLCTDVWFTSEKVSVRMIDEDEPTGPHWHSPEHTLYAGFVMGLAIRQGLDVSPIHDEHGVVTPKLQLHLPGHHDNETYRIVLVIPPPPDDWRFTTS